MEDLIAAFNQTKQLLVEQVRDLLGQRIKNRAIEFPAVEWISWKQYTPYWCDGDQCSFSVNSWSLCVNGESYDDYPTDSQEYQFGEIVVNMIDAIPEEIMEMAFGDNVEVVITRDGVVKFNEYSDHD